MSYLRIGLIVGAVVALAWLGHRVQLSFSQADEIAEQRAHIDALTLAAARDSRISQEMALFRGQQADFGKAFRDELAKRPLTIKVPPNVDPKTGAVEPCVVRDPVRYRELFNSAVTGTPVVP
jgi:hypothetical protein